jgi:ParB family chromosome partitioning protein
MAKSRGLGRGLDALLAGNDPSPEPTTARDRLTTLRLTTLQPGKYQPRSNMHEEAILELADSIRAQGVIQPILVRPVGQDRYEIIAGERRWRAAQKAGLEEVPVVIRDVADEAALAMALIENIQREDLNAIEEATGLNRLIREFGMTHQMVADAVGRSRAAVSNLLRLLDLPAAVREMLASGALNMGHARAVLGLSADAQLAVAHRASREGWSVRDVERHVARILSGSESAAPRTHPKDRDIVRLETDLSDRLGTRVEISFGKRAGSGRVIISYSSLEELDGLIERFR